MLTEILDGLPDAILVLGADGSIEAATGGVEAVLGWSSAELVGRPLSDLLPERFRERHAVLAQGFLSRPQRRRMGGLLELFALRRDGQEVPVDIQLAPLAAGGGAKVVAVVRDATERRALELESALRDGRMRTILELARVGTWELDLATGRRTYSAELLWLLGCEQAHQGTFEFYSAVHPDDRAMVEEETRRAIRDGTGYEIQLRVLARDGYRAFQTRATVDRDSAGAAVRLRGLAIDVTDAVERRRVEEALRATEDRLAISERMATIGLIAAGVAHEINNPLAAMSVNLQVIAADLGATDHAGVPARVRDAVVDTMEACERIRGIVADLRVFSRGAGDHLEPVAVEPILESALRMARSELRNRARVVREYSGVPEVLGNEARLGQVFLNLLVNAAQSIPPGRDREQRVTVTTALDPSSGRVVVSISDTGIGMSPEVAARVFDPFFTTKAASEGMGLGLSICRRILSDVGGDISVRSELGKGSTFEVSLPPADRGHRA